MRNGETGPRAGVGGGGHIVIRDPGRGTCQVWDPLTSLASWGVRGRPCQLLGICNPGLKVVCVCQCTVPAAGCCSGGSPRLGSAGPCIPLPDLSPLGSGGAPPAALAWGGGRLTLKATS